MEKQSVFIAIDLKSFYASVECRERGCDPLTTNLVVADKSRTEKTICLAVSPSLKSFGIPGRARLFEVVQKVREVNARRRYYAPGHQFAGKSDDITKLNANPSLELDYIVAPPQMALYMDYSARIYNVYLKYIAPEDIHTYSIDEVFIDATHYLSTYHMTAHELAMTMIRDVLKETGITATAGIGRLQWILWQNILNRMQMEYALQSWMSYHTGSSCGDTGHSLTFGGLDAATQRSWNLMGSTLWGMSPDAPLGNRPMPITKTCYTNYLASMPNCS